MANRYIIFTADLTRDAEDNYDVIKACPTVDVALKAFERLELSYGQGNVHIAKVMQVERKYSLKGDDGG